MHWLLRPAIGWGAWLLLHSIVIPTVYAIGKGCGKKECCKIRHSVKRTSGAIETAE